MSQPLFGLTLGCVVTFASGVRAEDNVPHKMEIEALIDQLASPNQAPRIEGPDAQYPPGFDREAQTKTFAAWQRLARIGPPAFPYLIETFNDKRYSFTRDTGEADQNFSVGAACRVIVSGQLEPWGARVVGKADYRERAPRPSYFYDQELYTPKDGKAWWRKHKTMTLVQLQIEALEWVIDAEAKRPKTYAAEERRFLRGTLEKLKREGTPQKPNWPFAK